MIQFSVKAYLKASEEIYMNHEMSFSEILELKIQRQERDYSPSPEPPKNPPDSSLPPTCWASFFFDLPPKKPSFSREKLKSYRESPWSPSSAPSQNPEETSHIPPKNKDIPTEETRPETPETIAVSPPNEVRYSPLELSVEARKSLNALRDLGALSLYKESFTLKDLKKAYKMLVHRFHPDLYVDQGPTRMKWASERLKLARNHFEVVERAIKKAPAHL